MKQLLLFFFTLLVAIMSQAVSQTASPTVTTDTPVTSVAGSSSTNDSATATAIATGTSTLGFPAQNVFWVRVQPPLPADIKTAGVYFELVDSPAFSDKFRQSLTASGYKVVGKTEAKYPIVVTGSFASTGKTETQANLGKLLEQSHTNANNEAQKGSINAVAIGNLGFDSLMVNKMMNAGFVDKFAGAGFMLNSLADATGFRNWFNEKMSGDKRGVCLGTCTTWHWSNQRVTLRIKEPQAWEVDKISPNIGVGVFSSRFWPIELTNLALIELHRYFELVDAPEPVRFPAVMTRDQIMKAQKDQLAVRME